MRSLAFRWIVLCLALGDLVVVLLHLAEVRVGPLGPDWFPSGRLRMNRDRGLAEAWGYAQTALAVALLLVVHQQARQPLALAWAGVLTLVVLDDSLTLHERIGTWTAQAWGLPAPGGLRGSDLGELVAWAFMGVLALALLLLGTRASTPRQRRAMAPLLGGFLSLMFFAVVVDMAHQALGSDGDRFLGIEINPALRFAEALGELISMTAILVAVLALLLTQETGQPTKGAPSP